MEEKMKIIKTDPFGFQKAIKNAKKASKNIRNFPSDFAMSISPERCRKKEMRLKWMHPQSFNLRHVRKPLYVEQKTHSKKTLVPT